MQQAKIPEVANRKMLEIPLADLKTRERRLYVIGSPASGFANLILGC
jgi:hypothetical protein